ncbi:Zinc finger CCCH-type antiviral protein 1 [Apodemus speciosus]|uniref:Poly [ADP-ribose] polymerase n=1 Tax=Apodemus speciosus TaxID=105296 RepID=A0ABQ0EV81_APOSI
MADPEVYCFITKILCAHGGRMTLEELLGEIRLPETQLYQLLETAGPDRFVLLETGDQAGITRSVVATTRARVCRRKYCQRPCDSLHLCKLNLLGRCHYAQSQRNLCKYSHDVLSEHNFQILKNHELSGLNQEELAVLLVQSDPFFLPEPGHSRGRVYEGEESLTLQSCNDASKSYVSLYCENAPHPHRRGGAHRDRSKSRDRFLHNSLELSTVSPLGSGPPSPDVTSCKDSLEDVSADITQKFKYLATHDEAQLTSASSKAAGVRGPSQMRASQEFPENGDADGLFSRNRSNSPSSRASAAGFPLDAAQRNEAAALKMVMPSGHRMEVKGKNEDIDHILLLSGGNIGGMTEEETAVPGALSKSATGFLEELEEMMFASNHQKSVAKTQAPQTTGRITDSGQDKAFLHSKYGENPAWAGTSTHNGPNGSSQIMKETSNVSKSSATGLGVKSAVSRGNEAVYSGVPSLRSQVLAMPGEITTPIQGSNRLPQSPLSPSSHRVAASGSPGENSTHASVSPASASEPARMMSDPLEHLLLYIISPISPRMDDRGPKGNLSGPPVQGLSTEGSCDRSHFHLPYRWQLFIFTAWMDFKDMEYIEQAYCDPQIEIILIEKHQINFKKMTCDSYPIRRLSTPSFAENNLSSVFTTKWLWYWKNELNEYIQYGNESPGHTSSDINSEYLESVFQFCPRGVLPFHAGSQTYELSFQGMIQTNIDSKTQRHVVRRPVFVSSKDVEQKRRGPDPQPVMPQADALTLYSLPQKNASPVSPNEYEFLELHSQDAEYATVSEHFKASMKHFKIVTIKRIWNQKLWDTFERKKLKMKNANEMLLFHATNRTHVDYICKNNFEWILHGSRETRYGKGNYFAKEAIYFHKTCSYDPRSTVMFVARVLVGNVIEGNMTFNNPPVLYDSCVDTRLNPSVFVIFRKEQIYPAYVIEYVESEKEKEKGCVIS